MSRTSSFPTILAILRILPVSRQGSKNDSFFSSLWRLCVACLLPAARASRQSRSRLASWMAPGRSLKLTKAWSPIDSSANSRMRRTAEQYSSEANSPRTSLKSLICVKRTLFLKRKLSQFSKLRPSACLSMSSLTKPKKWLFPSCRLAAWNSRLRIDMASSGRATPRTALMVESLTMSKLALSPNLCARVLSRNARFRLGLLAWQRPTCSCCPSGSRSRGSPSPAGGSRS